MHGADGERTRAGELPRLRKSVVAGGGARVKGFTNIVGDLFELVPALTAALKSAKGG